MHIGTSSLANLPVLRVGVRRERASSWDQTGGNRDYWLIQAGEQRAIFAASGAGCIKHIWFPMPFAESARIEIRNEAGCDVLFYFYVDWERYTALDEGLGRFHAQWRRENPAPGWGDDSRPMRDDRAYQKEVFATPNLTGESNYTILEAEGKGQYVGCHLDVDCLQPLKNLWWGEGDDMIFIDGEPWPPRLHGTGSEDYFNTAFCPSQEYCAPYHGVTVNQGTQEWPWAGKNSLYRFHIEDPVCFERSIRVTIEHGHANNLANDISSTAYWYQREPHRPFPPLPPVAARLPRPGKPDRAG